MKGMPRALAKTEGSEEELWVERQDEGRGHKERWLKVLGKKTVIPHLLQISQRSRQGLPLDHTIISNQIWRVLGSNERNRANSKKDRETSETGPGPEPRWSGEVKEDSKNKATCEQCHKPVKKVKKGDWVIIMEAEKQSIHIIETVRAIVAKNTEAKKDSHGNAMLDTGCTSNVAGEAWVRRYIGSLSREENDKVTEKGLSERSFRFGD